MLPGEPCSHVNREMYGCDNPVAFITGSTADRVGRRIAEYFLAAGFRVVVHAHHAEASRIESLQQLSNGRADLLLQGSVDDAACVEGWTSAIWAALGRCDVVVNSAAIWDPIPLEKITPADFQRYLNVNALGTALVCQKFGLALAKQSSGGAIINIGDWAIKRPYRDFAAYFPSKAAVKAITESMAVELATRNPRVRVNAILPGPVKLAEGITDARRQQIVNECLLKREGSADDVAHAAVFLATSPFVTGVSLPIDGGRSIYAGPAADPVAHPDA